MEVVLSGSPMILLCRALQYQIRQQTRTVAIIRDNHVSMTAPRTRKRKATEAEAEGKACTKIARTHHENSRSVAAGTDPWARLAATGGSASALGRGSLSGWTHCPLCGDFSKKKHAIGRGIANHLKDVHTPWNPGKLAQKIHRRQYERRERERQRSRKRPRPVEDEVTAATQSIGGGNIAETNEVVEAFKPLVSWTPTEEEEKAWVVKMMEILRKIEQEQTLLASAASNTLVALRKPNENTITKSKEASEKAQSDDKSGKLAIAYRDSLPPFLIAASTGNLMKLKEMVKEAKEKDKRKPVRLSLSSQTEKGDENVTEVVKIQNDHNLRILLNTRDRHKSTADHWAAGGGHLHCLRYLYNLRANLRVPDNQNQQDLESSISSTGKKNNKVRRRDGKTCLHYAARNGHVHCIRYLLEFEQSVQPGDENLNSHKLHNVDERSGEGTTPLHLACYGGHPRAVKHLVEEFGANPLSKNEWGCTCAHWAAMTLSESEADVRDLCGYLSKMCGISFVETQGQGHTALHKAAHRRNGHVIRWMAGSTSNGGAGLDSTAKEQAGAPDRGGHKPSDIWRRMGGDIAFAEWMKSSMGW